MLLVGLGLNVEVLTAVLGFDWFYITFWNVEGEVTSVRGDYKPRLTVDYMLVGLIKVFY